MIGAVTVVAGLGRKVLLALGGTVESEKTAFEASKFLARVKYGPYKYISKKRICEHPYFKKVANFCRENMKK